jgi:asparagine synthase (glutamine-hydrolysing)
MGVKPLYYRWDGTTLVFASEIKSLLEHPAISVEPNLPAIAEYMNAMYTRGEHTWFTGIKRLLPAHWLLAEPGGLRVMQWWDVPAHEEPLGKRPERYYIEKTRALLEDSVRLRLRSDVPLGSHLSGGLDSSAVVALLSRQLKSVGEPVRTFSGAFADGEEYDERRYVRAVVRRYRTDHRETLPGAGDLPRLFDRLVYHMDEPAAGPGILLQWAVCDLTRQSGVTVINGGQGGDEAWGGYFGYIPSYLRTLVRQARRDPAVLATLLSDAATIVRREHTRSSLVSALARGRRGRLSPEGHLGPWAGERFSGDTQIESAVHASFSTTDRTPLAAAMYADLKWYLPALLHVEDRTSMAFSLESRAPLLDYRLIELAASVPSALKLKNLEMKHILREAVKDLLPPVIYRRTDKKGMPTPTSPWFRGSLAAWVREQLLPANHSPSGLLDADYVRTAVEEHQSGRSDRSNDLWKMLNIEAWWKIFVERTSQFADEPIHEGASLATVE